MSFRVWVKAGGWRLEDHRGRFEMFLTICMEPVNYHLTQFSFD